MRNLFEEKVIFLKERLFSDDTFCKLMEAGFLWSLFFIPWGPVLRYFGWLIFLTGFVGFVVTKRYLPSNALTRTVRIILVLLLAWGAVTTLLSGDSSYWFWKGYSFVLEMCFGIWIASVVITLNPKALKKFFLVLSTSVLLAGGWTIVRFVTEFSTSGPFSNINTLGLFAITALPLCVSQLLITGQSRVYNWFFILSSVSAIFMIIMSFSTAAWICGIMSLVILFLCGLKWHRKRFLLKISSCILVLLFLMGGFWLISGECKNEILGSVHRELCQLNIFNGSSSINGFTNNRSDIWKGTWLMIREKPLLGWGWGQFRREFMKFNQDWWELGLDPLEAHNLYLEMMVNGGVINLLLYLFLIFAVSKEIFRNYRETLSPVYLGFIVLILIQLLYSMAGNIFLSREIACILWSVFGFSNTDLDRASFPWIIN